MYNRSYGCHELQKVCTWINQHPMDEPSPLQLMSTQLPSFPSAIAWHAYTITGIQIVTRFAVTACVSSRQGIVWNTRSNCTAILFDAQVEQSKNNLSRRRKQPEYTINRCTHLACLAIWEQPAAIINQSTVAATPIAPSVERAHCDVITSWVPGNTHTLHKSLFKNNNWSPCASVMTRNSAQVKIQVFVFNLVQVAIEMSEMPQKANTTDREPKTLAAIQ